MLAGPPFPPLLPDLQPRQLSRSRPITPAPPSLRHLRVIPKQPTKRRRRGQGTSSRDNAVPRNIKPKESHIYAAPASPQSDQTQLRISSPQLPGVLVESSITADKPDSQLTSDTAEDTQAPSTTPTASQSSNESPNEIKIHRPQPIKPNAKYPPIGLAATTSSTNSAYTPTAASGNSTSVPPDSTPTSTIRPRLLPATSAQLQPPAFRPLYIVPKPGGEGQLYQLIPMPSFPASSMTLSTTPRLALVTPRSITDKTIVVPKRRTRRCQNCNKLGCRGSQRRHLCTEK
ncbi:hypothetical protein BGW37DRAFT_483790 [Umbelopsis sp. PMI_123]|nr:hypothetical protein BGW37DRAFT_483790 [Umbelopsis sp. PMI_123]